MRGNGLDITTTTTATATIAAAAAASTATTTTTTTMTNTCRAKNIHAPLMEFMYLAFARMPGDSFRWRLRSLLLCSCDVLRALINSLVC